MLDFIINPRFWLPLVLLACIELLFRVGLWEPLAKPNSYAGTSVATKQSVRDFGLSRITGVTLGSSRTVYGLDHRRIFEQLAEGGETHLSLAMGGSHLAGFKVVSNWALKNMPDLKRVVIGVAAGSMNRIGNGSYEVALVEPFRGAADYWRLVPHFPPERGDLRSLGAISALMAYRADLLEYLKAPKPRHQALALSAGKSAFSRLTYSNRRSGNLCAFDLSTLAACRNELERLTATGRGAEPAARTFASYCQRPRNVTEPGAHQLALGQWLRWLQELSNRVEVTLVLMPEHSLLALPGDRDLAVQALSALRGANFRLLDLSQFFAGDECGEFSDLVHASQAGSAHATDRLLETLARAGNGPTGHVGASHKQ